MAKIPPIHIGDLIAGKYLVERLLGEGGIGIVVLAQHVELGQRVALKVLQDHGDVAVVERFMREARAAVRLKSEHIVRVTDVLRTDSGAPVMVMEYLEGEDLGHVVSAGAIGIADAADFLLQACEGIAEAHALGIIHRDIKPQNLFLARRAHKRPIVKVLDFGIAKTFTGLSDEIALTSTKAIMGSPAYMSPEQMNASRDVDARTDVWSLGVVLYELLAGASPFGGTTVAALCASVLLQPPVPIEERRPDVPPELTRVIAHCLMKNPSERMSNVADLAAALEPFAPFSSRGAAERVRAMLDAPVDLVMEPPGGAPLPPPSAPQAQGALRPPSLQTTVLPAATSIDPVSEVARTAASFESIAQAPSPRPRRGMLAAAVLLGIVVVVGGGLFLGSRVGVGPGVATDDDGRMRAPGSSAPTAVSAAGGAASVDTPPTASTVPLPSSVPSLRPAAAAASAPGGSRHPPPPVRAAPSKPRGYDPADQF